MSKKHMVKCKYCGEMFDANVEPYVMVSSRRYAHKECAEKHESEMTQEERDKEEFFKYAKKLFGEDFNFIATQKLANRYVQENNYTYSGMLKSLIWFYEIQHHSIDKANGSIGIIPYVYKEAKDYYFSLYLAQRANQKKDLYNFKSPPVEVVDIEPPTVYVKPTKLFDLD